MKKFIIIALMSLLLVTLAISTTAAVGTVVYGTKTDHVPNMEEIDDTWGEPAIYVTKDSPNADRME